MVSKRVHTTSCTIQCPTCGKSMLLKNWKDHCHQFHTISQIAIDCKYNELKKTIEKSKLGTTTSENPNPLSISTLFSMKKFALIKSTTTNENIRAEAADAVNQNNHSQLMETDSQHVLLDSTINCSELERSPINDIALDRTSIVSDFCRSFNENGMIFYIFLQ